MALYTDEERKTLRSAAFGAMYLVTEAEPGFFDAIKESLAGSRALANSSSDLRELLKGLPQLPKGSPAELESGILNDLRKSVNILSSKSPAELDGFRSAVTDACDAVAQASGGVSAPEVAAIGKVKSALGTDGTG